MLCGEAGSGKTFMLIEAIWGWLKAGWRAACLMLELDQVFHLKRLHAQLAGLPELLDMEWVAKNSEAAMASQEKHSTELDVFARSLQTVNNSQQLSVEATLEWVEKRCKAGCRVIVIDPITAISGDKPWVTDRQFLFPARKLCEDAGASLVLSTHPDRGGKSVAGSEAMKRFVDTTMWLARLDQPKWATVSTFAGRSVQNYNRTLKVTKARLGPGAGDRLAFMFDRKLLRFLELGTIVGDASEPAALPE